MLQRIVDGFWAWLMREGKLLIAALREPLLALLILAAGVAVTLAYQWQRPISVAVGGRPALDGPYLGDFYAPEVADPAFGGFPFRWSAPAASVRIPGLGVRQSELQLRLAGTAPGQRSLTLDLGPACPGFPGPIAIRPELRSYRILVPAACLQNGTLRLGLNIAPYQPAGARFPLGVALNQISVAPAGGGVTIPPPLAGLSYALGAGLVFLLLMRCGAGRWRAAIGGALWAAGLAALLRVDPLALALISGLLFGLLLLAYAIVVALAASPLTGRGSQPPAQPAWILAIVSLGFVLRMAGFLHPQIVIYDINFHVNRYNSVWQAGQYFLQARSSEWGMRMTYYPATVYLAMAPLRLIFADPQLVIKVFTALIDTSRIALIYLLIRRATGDARAATLAGFAMLALPIAILPYQWGIVSNLFGEWLALIVMSIVVLAYERLARPQIFALLTLALMLMLISHPGVVVIGGAALACLIGLLWLRRGMPAALPAALALAIVLSIAAYHWRASSSMIPQAWSTVQGVFAGGPAQAKEPAGQMCQKDPTRAAVNVQVGGPVIDWSIGLRPRCVHSWPEVFTGGLAGWLAEAWAYYWLLPLACVPLALRWLWRGGGAAQVLSLAWLSWVLAALLFAVVGLIVNLYVRYSLFALPVVAGSAGLALARIERRGRGGRLLVAALLLAMALAGLSLWYTRVMVTAH